MSLYRLHVALDGSVWYAVDDHLPVSSGIKPSEFHQYNPLQKDDSVIMLGTRSNAKLLVDLYTMKCNKVFSSLKVCSPLACRGEKRRQDPRIILMDILQLRGYAGSLGGWHECDKSDALHYLIASMKDFSVMPSFIDKHPAYKSLMFLPNLNMNKCVQLLSTIIDPRWYVDLDNPESHSQIQAYLGLIPKIQQYVSSDNEIKHPSSDLCKLVMNCWKTIIPNEQELDKPNNFLWRIWYTQNKDTMADLHVSHTFITYLRETWLNEIYISRGGLSKDGLFIPKYFFKTKDEVEAYEHHYRDA